MGTRWNRLLCFIAAESDTISTSEGCKGTCDFLQVAEHPSNWNGTSNFKDFKNLRKNRNVNWTVRDEKCECEKTLFHSTNAFFDEKISFLKVV